MNISNYNKGKIFEFIACMFLLLKGYKIIEKRYKNKFGEIDIICKKHTELIFIEVKYRKKKTNSFEAINSIQLMRMQNCAAIYTKNPIYLKFNIRFDAVLFYNIGIKHIKKIVGI